MREDRDHCGRFAPGNCGGPGRPRRATEAEYLQALSSIVSLADLVAIARRAVADAKKGSARARDWVSKYLLGDPSSKPPSDICDWKRVSQALLRRIRDELCPEQAVPTIEAGWYAEDRANGDAGAVDGGRSVTAESVSNEVTQVTGH
jgi:hypothetical protein